MWVLLFDQISSQVISSITAFVGDIYHYLPNDLQQPHSRPSARIIGNIIYISIFIYMYRYIRLHTWRFKTLYRTMLPADRQDFAPPRRVWSSQTFPMALQPSARLGRSGGLSPVWKMVILFVYFHGVHMGIDCFFFGRDFRFWYFSWHMYVRISVRPSIWNVMQWNGIECNVMYVVYVMYNVCMFFVCNVCNVCLSFCM